MCACVRACVCVCVSACIRAAMMQASPVGGLQERADKPMDFVTSMVEGYHWMAYFGFGHMICLLLTIIVWPCCCCSEARKYNCLFGIFIALGFLNWILGHIFLAYSPLFHNFQAHALHLLVSLIIHMLVNAGKLNFLP